MAQKPSIPKGTRDFGQREMAERNYIFDTVRSVFRTFGYQQIDTPAMENLSTLLGKYGDEGDKLLFRIQNSGEKAALPPEKGLRYDLTVPFARFVVQHQNEISFPFKRFQIQPVWRADRPQKGRYREFYQCDVDVIGSTSQVNELELVQIVDRVFAKLDVRVLLKINNRKVLTGLAEICGFPERVVDITVAIDKLDKIGLEKVEEEMMEKGLTAEAIAVLRPVLQLSGTKEEKIATMRGLFNGGSASGIVSEAGLAGVDELEELFGLIDAAGVSCPVEIDLSLARGLNYYTGAIFEVKALDFPIGSICGGGRYDNLTGIFGLPNVSGVGIPERLRRGHLLRCRPHLRRPQGPRQVPGRPLQQHAAPFRGHGPGRTPVCPPPREDPPRRRRLRRSLPRRRQTQEAVRLRREEGHPLHLHQRLLRDRSRHREPQEPRNRRPAGLPGH